MACDVRIASTTAKFRTGDAYLGVIPSWGMSLTRLVHYIGRNRTLDLLILGEDLSAEKAMELGLVTRVVPEGEFEDEIARVAARVAKGGPITFRAIKETVRAQYWVSPPAAQLEKLRLIVPEGQGREAEILGEGAAAAPRVVAIMQEMGVA